MKPDLTLVPKTPAAPQAAAAPGAAAPMHNTQTEMPFAVVEGQPVTELPRDLYIPPQALEVFLRPSRARSICCSI